MKNKKWNTRRQKMENNMKNKTQRRVTFRCPCCTRTAVGSIGWGAVYLLYAKSSTTSGRNGSPLERIGKPT